MYSRCSCRTRIVIAFAALVGAAPLAGAAGAVHSFAALVGAEPFAAAACAIVVATVAAPKLGAAGLGGGAPFNRGAFSPVAGVGGGVVCAALAAEPPKRGVATVAPSKMNVAGFIVGAAPKLGAVVCGHTVAPPKVNVAGLMSSPSFAAPVADGTVECIGALAVDLVCAAFATKPRKRVDTVAATVGGKGVARCGGGSVTGVVVVAAPQLGAAPVAGVGGGGGGEDVVCAAAFADDSASRLRARAFCLRSLSRRWRSLRSSSVSSSRASRLRFRSASRAACALRLRLCFSRAARSAL